MLFLARLFGRLHEDGALGINLESALGVLATFLQLLDEPQRGESLGVHPALIDVIDAVHEVAAAHIERGVPGGTTAEIVEADDFHVGVAHPEYAEFYVVLHSLADGERNLGMPDTGGSNFLRRSRLSSPIVNERHRQGSRAKNQTHHAAPPAVRARRRAFRVKRKRLSASATGRTLDSLVLTS